MEHCMVFYWLYFCFIPNEVDQVTTRPYLCCCVDNKRRLAMYATLIWQHLLSPFCHMLTLLLLAVSQPMYFFHSRMKLVFCEGKSMNMQRTNLAKGGGMWGPKRSRRAPKETVELASPICLFHRCENVFESKLLV